MNSLPSKYSLPTTVFSHFEDPFDKKCYWKELLGALRLILAKNFEGSQELSWPRNATFFILTKVYFDETLKMSGQNEPLDTPK